MSILSNRLTRSAGLGGIAQGGPHQNYNTPMPSQSTGSGVLADFKNAGSDVRQGKISIAVIETLIILMVLWYMWTHAIQGGG